MEENYFSINGTTDRILDLQTQRDKVTVNYPSNAEATYSGFKVNSTPFTPKQFQHQCCLQFPVPNIANKNSQKFVDIDQIKKAGITNFFFHFGGTTTEFTASVAASQDPLESQETACTHRGSITIKSYKGDLSEKSHHTLETLCKSLENHCLSRPLQSLFHEKGTLGPQRKKSHPLSQSRKNHTQSLFQTVDPLSC